MPEIINCPACTNKLQVPEEYFGKTVQCPECKQMFTAGPAGSAPEPPAAVTAAPDRPTWEKPPSQSLERDQDDKDDYDDRPRRSRFDDDYDRDRPRRYGLAPHRSGTILAFGLLAILNFLPFVFGPLAWIMGNADLREMKAGRMDPSGESQTNVGRVLGMIATLLMIFGLVTACVVVGGMIILGITAGHNAPPR